MIRKSVIVAMSGGIDSAVSAQLLLKHVGASCIYSDMIINL
jgi:tRNA U34 2-thiouridine synthase MnmA/TrmU